MFELSEIDTESIKYTKTIKLLPRTLFAVS